MEIEREIGRVFTDSVRELSRKIVDASSEILTINNEALERDLASRLQTLQNEPKSNSDLFADESLSPENELGLNLFLDVVNFCYQNPYTQKSYEYINKEGKSKSRSTGLKAAMAESGINWGNTKEVADLTPEKWAEIIQLDKNKEFYLGTERGKRIAGFAFTLAAHGFKNITGFLTYVEYDTENLLPTLNGSGYFTDEFAKRSQLSVNMMDGVLKRRFSKEFKGMETLTVMADYRLPQLMYNFGTIELAENLRAKLMKQEIIETRSPEELALRAATITVGEKLSKLMGMSEGQVDSLLWTLAGDLGRNGKLTIPHMLVPTDKY